MNEESRQSTESSDQFHLPPSENIENEQDRILSELKKDYEIKNNNDKPSTLSSLIWKLLGGIFVLIILSRFNCIDIFSLFKFNWYQSEQENITFTVTENQNLLVVIKNRQNGEIRLINPLSGFSQDISLGEKNISCAALSPNGSLIAYVLKNESETKLYLYRINKIDSTSEGDIENYNNPISVFSSNNFCICEWSGLYWAPMSDKIAFFACDDNNSYLYIVSASPNSKPYALKYTTTTSEQVRHAIWLKNEAIVFTSGENEFISLKIIAKPDSNENPKRIYGIIGR